MSERDVTEEIVYQEHLEEVNRLGHWTYLIGVIVIGFVAMIVLISVLGGG